MIPTSLRPFEHHSDVISERCRSPTVVNLDPANDELPYECAIDVRELISCSDVMDAMGLGPNGGLMYCIDFLRENIDWLDCRIDAIKQAKPSGASPCVVPAKMPPLIRQIVESLSLSGEMLLEERVLDAWVGFVAQGAIFSSIAPDRPSFSPFPSRSCGSRNA